MILALAGCAHEQIPNYSQVSGPRALQILRDRAHAIRTVSAPGLITLTRGDGETVRLDAVVVLQPPDRARLRAWKFGQAVFDMTITPDGLWIMEPASDEHGRDLLAGGSNVARLTRQWLQLIAGSFDDPNTAVHENGATLLLEQTNLDGTTMDCTVDRSSVTPRRYIMKDRGGKVRFTLVLGSYADFGGIVWPCKIEAMSESGRILIDLRDVEINCDLPPQAFLPPARAEKLQ